MPITLIAINKATLLRAQSLILGCEACSPEAEIPFDWLLDDVTGFSGSEVDYVLSEAARCAAKPGTMVFLVLRCGFGNASCGTGLAFFG